MWDILVPTSLGARVSVTEYETPFVKILPDGQPKKKGKGREASSFQEIIVSALQTMTNIDKFVLDFRRCILLFLYHTHLLWTLGNAIPPPLGAPHPPKQTCQYDG